MTLPLFVLLVTDVTIVVRLSFVGKQTFPVHVHFYETSSLLFHIILFYCTRYVLCFLSSFYVCLIYGTLSTLRKCPCLLHIHYK